MSKKDDLRMGSLITEGDSGSIVLLGVPCDLGVARNGGRPGAARGPAAVRAQLAKMGTIYNPELDIDLSRLSLSDAGDVAVGTLEETLDRLESTVAALLAKGKVPFVIGGGNDQSAANGRALLSTKASAGRVGIINIDAHFDVRPLIDGKVHSGSPFRELLDDDRWDGHDFVEFAAQGNQCSAAHTAYLREKGASIVWLSAVQRSGDAGALFKSRLTSLAEAGCTDIFVSFDIDSISGADCPGVSCVSTIGLSAKDALDICFVAGADPRVTLFDLSEFNPDVESHRTGRLVANMFYYFCLGFAQRMEETGIGQL